MWGDESMVNNEGAGYFDNSKTGSPSTAKKGDNQKRIQSVTPVCIGMIQNHPGEELTIWGNPTNILNLVCIVRSFEASSTTVTYEIEDHTGKMKALLWLEHDAESSNSKIPVDKENIYVKVFGTLRLKEGEKVIMILKIAPINSLNEITCHLLEMISARINAEKKFKNNTSEIRANNPGAELSNSMMSFAGGDCMEEAGMTPMQRTVYRYMKSVATESGFTRDTILKHFPPSQKTVISEAILFLVSEGHIFSTIDHDHFQLTAA